MYQTSRALGNLIIVMFGGKDPFKRLQVLMSFIPLLGWSFLSLFDRPSGISLFSFTPYLSETDGGGTGTIMPLFALFCVGLGESIVILQRSTMMETAKASGIVDESLVAQRFTFQYAFVSLGAAAAFIVGGWIYSNMGYYAVCDFGMIVQFLHLFGVVVFLCLVTNSKKSLKQNTSVNIIWPYMRAVVATQAISALCIGVFLSTALLSYTARFPDRCGASQVGLLLGIGEGTAVVGIFTKSLLTGRKFKKSKSVLLGVLRAIISRPLNVPFILFVASLSCMLFSVDNYIVAVTFQMTYSCVNDLSVSLMNELTGTSIPPEQFKYYQGIGQWLRRLGNVLTAILGPIFFGIDEKLPFLFFGKSAYSDYTSLILCPTPCIDFAKQVALFLSGQLYFGS